MRLLDEVVQHLFGVPEVGDHAVLHRLDGDDVARSAAKHVLGFLSHGLDLVGDLVHRDNRRLVDDDPLAMREHKRIRRAQVDG